MGKIQIYMNSLSTYGKNIIKFTQLDPTLWGILDVNSTKFVAWSFSVNLTKQKRWEYHFHVLDMLYTVMIRLSGHV